ncbi:hypothetical protein C8Q80DRAFT_1100762 [Daedaleopsis nitida]|nr:hypothetical protein C8Q80DRAFT_1100762 [Daedaleopsis nitida]
MLEAWGKEEKVFRPQHGWYTSFVYVPMPCTKFSFMSEDAAPKFKVTGLQHRDIIDLVLGCLSDKTSRFARNYHFVPNKTYWTLPHTQQRARSQLSDSSSSSNSSPPPLRVFTDCYNTDAMLADKETIRKMERIPGDDPDVEYVALPLLFWSDKTVLSSFGSAKLWPIYLYLGALSKYVRGRPTEFVAHHVAYIPDLPDSFADEYEAVYNVQPSAEVIRFCRRELFCQIWLFLMNEKFMQAYVSGILAEGGDDVKRRHFIRVYTYSADYTEKVKIATLKPNSTYMVPLSLVHKDELCEAGTPVDALRRSVCCEDDPATHARIAHARKLIFEKGYSLAGKRVKDLLSKYSLTPTQSAFSIRLSPHGVNSYQILAPDLMHEFELGVWRGIFDHLVRLIHAQPGDNAIKEFNRRMRLMPKWGRDRIRRFYEDASTRKRMAAHDYEAYLIVIIPVIEGLLPLEDDSIVANMLFELSNWHALAKLCMHHEVTLRNMELATSHMYEAIRKFASTTCARHETFELPSETEARARRARTRPTGAKPGDSARRSVTFNVINTFKYYSLGDYTSYIRRSGTTDNFTTQVGELEHRHVKRVYDRTNKVNFERQIALHQQKRGLVASWRASDDYIVPSLRKEQDKRASIAEAESLEQLARASPSDHYFVSQSRRTPIHLRTWVSQHRNDLAVKGFIPQLYEHLAAQMLGGDSLYAKGDEFTREQLNGIRILEDRIYQHKYVRINYTTYDMRREQDVIHPRRQADIMVPSPEWDEGSPYWYARVLGVFHAHVSYQGPDSDQALHKWHDFDFLWVRWYTREAAKDEDSSPPPFGFEHRCQPRLQFIDANDQANAPFSFVDPDDVIRAAYILPCPAGDYPLTNELLGRSPLARQIPVEPGIEDDEFDYEFYTAAMFADRDIFMRYHGGGIGHRGTWLAHQSPGISPELDYLDEEDVDMYHAEPDPDQPDDQDDDPDTIQQDALGADEDEDEGFEGNKVDFEIRNPENEDDEDAYREDGDGDFGSDMDDNEVYYDLYAADGFAPL